MKDNKLSKFVPLTIVNILFLMAQISGFMLSKEPALRWTFWKILILVVGSLLGACVIDMLIHIVHRRLGVGGTKAENKAAKEDKPFLSFPLMWLILFATYIPLFLIFCPGICAYDTNMQLEQILSGAYIDHHPIIHTLIMGIFRTAGQVWENPTLAMALFVVFQMVALSWGLAFSVSLLNKKGLSNPLCLVLLILFALFPYNAFMALSTTKDTLFAAALVPFSVLFWEAVSDGRNEMSPKLHDIAMGLLLLPVIFFRTNARYAVFAIILMLVVVTVFCRKSRKLYARLTIVFTVGTVAALLILSIVIKALNVTQGDRREMLNIPIQQVARVAYYHDRDFSEEENWNLNEFILNEAWRDYTPALSDPVKKNVNTYHVRNRLTRFAKFYLGLFKRYPGEYVNAALGLDAGYIYLFDTSCLKVYGDYFGYGFVQTAWAIEEGTDGINKASLIPGLKAFTEKLASDNTLQKLPAVGFLFRPGYVLWAYIYLMMSLIYRKRAGEALPSFLAFLYIGTLILGPCVQMRYIYPVWALLPLCLAAAFISTKKKNP